ncbi:MAG: IPT/TIG domain-containing protein, partial [candidate division Zixibacteria bacterium]|nr:IPT/TIG domain-containing protein [candidate division Zixibacteria bacterium]
MNKIWKKGKVRILKLSTLAILATGLMSPSVYAQGSIFGTVTNSNLTIPANGEISFIGYLDDTDEEIRIETSVGAGYDNGNWFDDFQNYLTEVSGNPYDYLFYNITNGQGFHLEKTIPNNSFQQENVLLGNVSWPVIPSGLNAVTVSSSSVALNWNSVPNLTYHIYRRVATSNGSFFRLDNTAGLLTDRGVSDSFFVDVTVDGVSSYTYLIIAEDNLGNLSAHSNLVTANSAVVNPPILISINPSSGPETGATLVNIFGIGFDTAGTSALFGVSSILGTVISPLHLTVTTPPTLPGAVNVTVTNTASALSSNTLVNGYTYTAQTAPVLTAIGAKNVIEGELLSFTTTAVDPEGNTPVLTSSALPGTATYVDNQNGTANFNWTPTFLDQGIYTVTFYAIDSILPSLIDSEVVTITVIEAVEQMPILFPLAAKLTTWNIHLYFFV